MKVFLVLIVLFFVFGCTAQQLPELSEDTLCIEEKVCVQIERAKTPSEQARGLMFRESLAEDSSMLFLFEKSASRSFWMKNTLISLDMIWIDEDKKIVGITANVPPCTADPCPNYPSPSSVKFVLEINAGFAEKNGLKTGDKVEFLE